MADKLTFCWATCFVLVLIFHLHFSHTHGLRGWSVKTASQRELCQTYTRLVRQMKCVMFNHKFMYKFSLHRKYWAWNGRSHFQCKMEVIMAGVVSLRKLHYVLSQLYCVLAWCRKHPSNCGIHGVQRIFEQIRTNPLFACNYKASSLIVLLRFWASFSIKDIHGRLLTNDSSSNVSLKNQHLHLSSFIVYAWDQETSWLCYIFFIIFLI